MILKTPIGAGVGVQVGGNSSVSHSGCITLLQVQQANCIFFEFFRNLLGFFWHFSILLVGYCAGAMQPEIHKVIVWVPLAGAAVVADHEVAVENII